MTPELCAAIAIDRMSIVSASHSTFLPLLVLISRYDLCALIFTITFTLRTAASSSAAAVSPPSR